MPDGDALQAVSHANDLFTTDIYGVLAESQGNLFFSPWSIQVILALAFLGAGGNTAKQMARGLRLPEDKTVVEEGFGEILRQLKEANDITLRVGNRVFVKQNFSIHERFKQSADKFMAEAQEMDFLDSGAPGLVNSWVSDITNGKISKIIADGAFNEDTRMVLVNAVYFKGNWSTQFNKDATQPRPFRPASQPPQDVDLMATRGKFMYTDVDELNSQALLLPYKGDRLGMLIILPREVSGIRDVEKNLQNVTLERILSRMYVRDVVVNLPKFKMEFQIPLSGPLGKLGMTEMFDDDHADFSGISKRRLKVSNVVHKSFIEVNEEGTEAAAATGISFHRAPAPPPPPPIIFIADHPFIFFILDQTTRAVLFAGRISEPPFNKQAPPLG